MWRIPRLQLPSRVIGEELTLGETPSARVGKSRCGFVFGLSFELPSDCGLQKTNQKVGRDSIEFSLGLLQNKLAGADWDTSDEVGPVRLCLCGVREPVQNLAPENSLEENALTIGGMGHSPLQYMGVYKCAQS